ncbi:glutaconyl-CoA decarboxylase subunit gamma [Achromobacter aloeverae]|uniref:Glutaconyl-CoA decarboxylase subunit gamma n=2 Tax=Achromobacter aloeverae TaxID=1750518 RepID=A0A4Q1HQT8_9BURK|nr:glutaconyl-CoA decarboxylase subunit gamma [Achromobacter aloeverae]
MDCLRKRAAIAAALLLATTVLAACDKKEDKPAAPAASTPAPSTSTPTPSTPSPSSATPAPSSSTASAADVPAECDAYIRKVNACMDKLGANSPAVATFRQQMDAARAQWSGVSDKTALAAQCKQSTDLFAQSASQLGCQ